MSLHFVVVVVTCLPRSRTRGINLFIDDLVPKGVHENRTKGVENKVDDTLKLVVFLERAQC